MNMMNDIPSDETVKQTAHKPPMHLILWKTVRWFIRIRMYGLEKYPNADNWKHVPPLRWWDAAMRHMVKWQDGELIDPESGMPHLAHALTNIWYLIELTEEEAEF